jgi:DNA-binding CsgD family transcriptional regulator
MGERDCSDQEWLELVADLMAAPLGVLPVERLAVQLVRTFRGMACSFSATLPDGRLAGDIYPLTEPLGGHRAVVEDWGARQAHRVHPILLHYRGTGRAVPMQVADVPDAFVDRRLRRAWYATAGGWGCAEQVAMPLSGPLARLRGFVVGRDRPFTAAEVAAAGRFARLLSGLDRQVRALAGRHPEAAAQDARITPRELAVLALLGDGLTAAAIGRRLAIGERTVHKHLEHVYAKLRVTDRLSAVVRAREAGLLPADAALCGATMR